MSAISNFFKSSFVLGFGMIVVMLAISRLVPFLEGKLIALTIPGLVAGVAYAALHGYVMSRGERFKALLPFVLVMSASAFVTGLDQLEAYSLGFVITVSTGLSIAYAVSSFVTLWLGSFAYVRLTGKCTPSMTFDIGSLKNSYVLGFIMIGGEIAFNFFVGLFTSSGASGGGALLMAFFAGALYARWYKKKMPALERGKALLVYFGFVLFIAGASFFTAQGFAVPWWVLFVIGATVFGFFGLCMYFALWWGSWLQFRSDEMKRTNATS